MKCGIGVEKIKLEIYPSIRSVGKVSYKNIPECQHERENGCTTLFLLRQIVLLFRTYPDNGGIVKCECMLYDGPDQ